MKKITFLTLLVFGALSFMACSGSGNGQLHNLRGLVKHVQADKDRLVSMTVGIEDDDSIVFSLDDNTRYQNGTMLLGDSVLIDFIDGRDKPRALVVTVLPKTINITETIRDSLVTAPAKEKVKLTPKPHPVNIPKGSPTPPKK